jgi:hypothetical protein
MEKSAKDIKLLIADKLSRKDLLSCSKVFDITNNNNFWLKKLKEDFEQTYEGDNAFDEYKFQDRLEGTLIYNLIFVDDSFQKPWVKTFRNKEKAFKYMVNLINKNRKSAWVRDYIQSCEKIELGKSYWYRNGYLFITISKLK